MTVRGTQATARRFIAGDIVKFKETPSSPTLVGVYEGPVRAGPWHGWHFVAVQAGGVVDVFVVPKRRIQPRRYGMASP